MTRVVTTAANLGELNQDDEERINIIGLAGDYSVGGQERFKGLEAYQLRTLLENNFMKWDSRHNDAPINESVLDLLETHPVFRAGGYVISPNRDDYRVSIDTIHASGEVSEEARQAFISLCRYADDFASSPEESFAWYD